MPRKPKVWFDYEYLASLDDPEAPREAFFLDEPAQQVLSQLAEMVLWPTRWFNGDEAAAHAMAYSIYEQLKMPLHFDDLIPYLDDVETLLQALLDQSDQNVIIDQLCCANGVIAPVPNDTGDDVVRGVGDPPNDIVDWPTYDVHLCSSAQKFVDSLPNWVSVLEGLSVLTTVGLSAAIAGLAAGLAAAGIVATAVLGVTRALEFLEAIRDLIGLGPSWSDARTALQDAQVKQDLVCAIVKADTAADAEADIDNYLDSINSDAAAAVRTLPLRYMMSQIFAAEADAGGYGGPCNCPPDTLGSWDWGSSDNGWDGWTNDAGASLETTYAYRFLWGLIMYRTFTLEAGTTQVTISMHAAGPAGIPQRVRVQARDGASVSGTILATVDHDFESNETFDYVLNVSARTGANITINVYKDSGSQSYRPQLFDATSTYS